MIIYILFSLFVIIVSIIIIKKKKARVNKDIKEYTEKVNRSEKRKIRFIFCEYCGARIDIRKDDNCPSCGASYVNNTAFRDILNSIENDEDFTLEPEKEEKKNPKRRKILIIILLVVLISIISFVVLYNNGIIQGYNKSDEISDYYKYYTSFEDNSISLEDGKIELKLLDVYARDTESYLITVEVKNNTNKLAHMNFHVNKINGFSTNSYSYISITPNKTLIKTFNVWLDEEFYIDNLNSISIDDIYYVIGKNDYVYTEDEYKFNTNEQVGLDKIKVEIGDLAYENEVFGLEIYHSDDKRYLIFVNEGDSDIFIEAKNGTFNNVYHDDIYSYYSLTNKSIGIQNVAEIFDEYTKIDVESFELKFMFRNEKTDVEIYVNIEG